MPAPPELPTKTRTEPHQKVIGAKEQPQQKVIEAKEQPQQKDVGAKEQAKAIPKQMPKVTGAPEQLKTIVVKGSVSKQLPKLQPQPSEPPQQPPQVAGFVPQSCC